MLADANLQPGKGVAGGGGHFTCRRRTSLCASARSEYALRHQLREDEILRYQTHCNACGGIRDHEVIGKATQNHYEYEGDQRFNMGYDLYRMLQCAGCKLVKMNRIRCVAGEEPIFWPEEHFPPMESRRLSDLMRSPVFSLGHGEFVPGMLEEIYGATNAGHLRLAAAGVRSLIDQVLTEIVGDIGNFSQKLEVFSQKGHLSLRERDRIKQVIEAGHAAIHRGHQPQLGDVGIMLEITEHMLLSVYVHDQAGQKLESSTPARPARGSVRG
ncbi:DUF4145 domain-containing protein [Achromobacter sp. 2789STDY5608615]|uniref:DUF4145 domain-containing protein n=1 Tax=Achromobacter sp. 2789STDY5608615 TaxID=1806492 RepID=UPI0012E217C8|nr:DUF4145 domain-containing protein [Achromobacter sp. 2789STDY5608615]